MTLVFNASPLIVLAKTQLLDRLLPLGNKVWIPEAVANEVSAVKDPGDPAYCWITEKPSLIHPATPLSPFLLAWDLP
jgi:hypothetical protein